MWVSKTVPFAGTCSAQSVLTLVSQRIVRPYRTRQITVRFPAGCQNLMPVRFYLSEDATAPTSGPPTGVSLLQDYGQVDYIRGDAIQIVLNHRIQRTAGGSYLKLYANNTDFYDHAVDADIEIEVEEGDGD